MSDRTDKLMSWAHPHEDDVVDLQKRIMLEAEPGGSEPFNSMEWTRVISERDPGLPKDRFHDIDPHDVRFMKLSRRVCLIERDDGPENTGILVGPDLLLTAAHGLRGTAGVFADPDTVTIKFDHFEWDHKSGLVAMGDQCRLRQIPFSKPKQPDVIASSIKVDPKSRRQYDDNELDYVLVRLDRPMGLSFLPYSHRIRGWNDCSAADVPPGGRVFVVQHPLGQLQRFAEGYIPVKRDDPDFPNFFRYRTASAVGTSGAPITNLHQQVIGMHVGERSETEQLGVSFQDVFEDIQNEGVTLPPFNLTKEVMDSIFGTSAVERERKRGLDWRGDRLFDDGHRDQN
jgi:Fe-S-cluster formation regulator IscX/YfhJ